MAGLLQNKSQHRQCERFFFCALSIYGKFDNYGRGGGGGGGRLYPNASALRTICSLYLTFPLDSLFFSRATLHNEVHVTTVNFFIMGKCIMYCELRSIYCVLVLPDSFLEDTSIAQIKTSKEWQKALHIEEKIPATAMTGEEKVVPFLFQV